MRTFLSLVFGVCLCSDAALAALICTSSAVPTIVNSEGLAERMGDIVLTCSGGGPGQMVTGNLTLLLSVPVTNRTNEDFKTDVMLTVDNGLPAPPPPAFATAFSPVGVAFNGLGFNLSTFGGVTLRVSNLRGAVAQQGVGDPRPITVFVSFYGTLPINTATPLSVGLPMRGLLASSSSTTIYCVGSPTPSIPGISAFFAAGTSFHSTRLTEGWAGAFQKRGAGNDAGTRILARYTGLPPGARLFAPDFVAGSDAAQPTAGGDLGAQPSGGKYTGGSGALLLGLVRLTDTNGAGGALTGSTPPPSVTATFDSTSEIPLVNGAGVVVYEVLESDPSRLQSAQFPAFLIYTPPAGGGNTEAGKQEVSFAPLSTQAFASTSAPVPRYTYAAPPSDCAALGDCNASYFPKLSVNSPSLDFTAPAGSAFQYRNIGVHNEGGGVLNWTIAVTYRTGSGWIRVDPAWGQNNTSVRIDVLPEKLTPGIYEADLTVDAGPVAGSRTARVRLEVTQYIPPPPLPPAIRGAVNAATFQAGPLVPGSLGTLFGARFAGRVLSVTFDGIAARVLFSKEDQINLLVPPELAGRTAAQVVVKVDGVSSVPLTAQLAAIAPGIFGTLNQDYTVNSAANAAPAGSVVQVFATGLPERAPSTILAQVHDRDAAAPLWAGPAPGFAGVQQVNVWIPDDLPAMTTDIRVCAYLPERPAERICSPPSRITLR